MRNLQIRKSLASHLMDQRDALLNQFVGMTDVGFDHSAFEETLENLIKSVIEAFTYEDKLLLIAFERGKPDWEVSEYDSFKN